MWYGSQREGREHRDEVLDDDISEVGGILLAAIRDGQEGQVVLRPTRVCSTGTGGHKEQAQ